MRYMMVMFSSVWLINNKKKATVRPHCKAANIGLFGRRPEAHACTLWNEVMSVKTDALIWCPAPAICRSHCGSCMCKGPCFNPQPHLCFSNTPAGKNLTGYKIKIKQKIYKRQLPLKLYSSSWYLFKKTV